MREPVCNYKVHVYGNRSAICWASGLRSPVSGGCNAKSKDLRAILPTFPSKMKNEFYTE